MAKEMKWKKLCMNFFDEFSQCAFLSLVLSRWRYAVQYKIHQFVKFAQKIFIFAQNLDKFTRKKCAQILEKITKKNKKLSNTCSPAIVTHRSAMLGGNMSYCDPLIYVRGWMHYVLLSSANQHQWVAGSTTSYCPQDIENQWQYLEIVSQTSHLYKLYLINKTLCFLSCQ